MRKVCIILSMILLFLCSAFLVSAIPTIDNGDYGFNIEITKIRSGGGTTYDREYNSDESWDTDKFYAIPDKKLGLSFKVINNNETNITFKFDSTLELDDGDINCNEGLTRLDGGDEDYKAIACEFYIPSGTREDTYNYRVDVEVTYKNGTSSTDNAKAIISKDFDIEVLLPEVQQEDALRNLTQTISDQKAQANFLMSSISNLSSESQSINEQLRNCNATLTSYMNNYNWSTEYKGKYETECVTSASQKERADRCEEAKKSMFSLSDVEMRVATAKMEQKSQDNNFLILAAVIAGAAYFISKRRKQVGGQGDGKPITRTWK